MLSLNIVVQHNNRIHSEGMKLRIRGWDRLGGKRVAILNSWEIQWPKLGRGIAEMIQYSRGSHN